MILSASGWRKVFAQSGNCEDSEAEISETDLALCALIGESFAEYLEEKFPQKEIIVSVATDTRPTGRDIADAIIRVLLVNDIKVRFLGIAAAPEIMAYARSTDGFVYISASHNPIGYNGIKFGDSNGGVLEGSETQKIADSFMAKCVAPKSEERALELLAAANDEALADVYNSTRLYKKEALKAYSDFMKIVVSGAKSEEAQNKVLKAIKDYIQEHPISVVCDMNGSARTLSIDQAFLESFGIDFLPFNNQPGHIVHAIIPEPENLTFCSDVIQDLQRDGNKSALLGYMPDCDGDRGNMVYWDNAESLAKTIGAQEIFALSVISETAFEYWKKQNICGNGLLWKTQNRYGKHAVVVNGPTSMRIDDICRAMNFELFRAEVGEANVVNLARKKWLEGYTVNILGEGSNGGNITHPSCVRDPIATLFAVLKLLSIRDTKNSDGSVNKGLFHIWCEKSGQEFRYKDDFTLYDIFGTIPAYKTTGVSQERAMLKINTSDVGLLKEKFHKVFLEEWENHLEEMDAIYGIKTYEAITTNGIQEKRDVENWNNQKGGLKILFYDEQKKPVAFIWMRPSGTEPVFRIMCDARGQEEAAERSLLRWETSMLRKADS